MAELLKKDDMKPGSVVEGGSAAQNYTGSWRTYCPVTEFEDCIHCMQCWIACPDSAIEVEDEKKVGTDMQYCKGCGICAAVCPVDCIEMVLESEIPEGGQKG